MTPRWLATLSTSLIIIWDKTIDAEVSNLRPITCLSLMWKLLTGILSEEMYQHLKQQQLLSKEQKGCKKRSRETKDQLLIDKMIVRNCKRRHNGLAVGWIDYRKAYHMVLHSWIIECLKMFKVADNMIKLIMDSMTQWEMILKY